MQITSITIGGTEWLSRTLLQQTQIGLSSGGDIGTASLTVIGDAADVRGILGRSEVILYSGAAKKFGGYASIISEVPIGGGTKLRADIQCQDYTVLLDRVVVTSEATYSGTDAAALADLFSTYLTAISTASVNTVEASLILTVSAGTSMRQAVEAIAERSGAVWWVDADKSLHYGDAADIDAAPFELVDDETLLVDYGASNIGSGLVFFQSSYTYPTWTESADSGQHYCYKVAPCTDEENYTLYVDVEPNGRNWIALGSQAFGPYSLAFFDIESGVLGSVAAGISASITRLTNTRYRCQIGFAAEGTGNYSHVAYLCNVNGSTIYDGGGGGFSSGFDSGFNPGLSAIDMVAFRLSTGQTHRSSGFTYSRDSSTLANSITVNSGNAGETLTQTIKVKASADDALTVQLGSAGSGWPPGDTPTSTSNQTTLPITTGWDSGVGKWRHNVAFVRFDTSSLADLEIVNAKLRLYVGTLQTDNLLNGLSVAYYDSANWPITAADHANTQSATAYGVTDVGSVDDQWLELLLQTPETEIYTTGYTGFRIMYEWGTPPSTGSDFAFGVIASGESQGNIPEIVVTYRTPSFTATATDATSIATYGLQAVTIVDSAIESNAAAALRAAVELAKLKDPQRYGTAVFAADGADRGQRLHITSDIHGIDDDFILRGLRMSWETDARTLYTAEYGDYRPDLVAKLRKLIKAQG